MRAFLILAAVFCLSRPAAAAGVSTTTATAPAPAPAPVAVSSGPTNPPHPSPDITDWFAGPAAPFLMAWDMDERGLSRYPYDPVDDFNSGKTSQFWVRGSHQFTEGGREANHVEAGLRLDARLGGDFEWSKFRAGAFNFSRAADWFSFHAVSDLSQGDRTTFEYGFGVTTLQGNRSLIGPAMEFRGEYRLEKPWTLYGRYAPSFLTDGRFYHELSAGVGVNWKRIGVDAAYRTLLNPLRDSYGPELGLRFFF